MTVPLGSVGFMTLSSFIQDQINDCTLFLLAIYDDLKPTLYSTNTTLWQEASCVSIMTLTISHEI